MTETKSSRASTRAVDFWRHIFGDGCGFLQVFTAVRADDKLTNPIWENFNYPGAANRAEEWALKKSKEGREVYFCAHLLTHPKRKKENAAEIRALWGELDGISLPNGNLSPSVVVASSPGRYHAYWVLADAVPPQVAEQLNRRIAHEIGADLSGYDLTQLLRVPGTVNHKYQELPTVEVIEISDTAYSPRDLDELLPQRSSRDLTMEYEPSDVEDAENEPPVALNQRALKVWRGEDPKPKDTGEIDRSGTLVKIGRVLFDAGANQRVVIEGIKERDIALGYRKYADRTDADKQYAAIFNKVLKKEGRNARLAPSRGDVSDVSDVSDVFSTQTPPFPIDALPKDCARYTREAAASLRCPPELVGLPVLCALSAAMGYTRELRIKHGWSVSGSLYAAVVDDPGSKKSPAQRAAYKPLEKLQANLRKDYKKLKQHYEQEMRQHAVDKKLAAKDDLPEPEPPIPPKLKRCIVDDITVEALAGRLEENPRGFLSAHDELTGFIRGLDQYKSGGKGNARQSYLKIWSNTPIYVDRKGSDEPMVVPSPYVTLQGSIQPSVLHEIAGGRNDGFLDRFIFAYPEPSEGGYSEDTVSPEAEIAYRNVINGLWNKQLTIGEDGDPYPRGVSLDQEAKRLFVLTVNALAKERISVGFPPTLQGPWAKFDTHLARLALILAVTRSVEDNEDGELVTGNDMRNALRLTNYFKATARKVCRQLFEASPDAILTRDITTFLSRSGYVFSGTVSQLHDEIDSVALPHNEKGLGRALDRIVKQTPAITLERQPRGDERIIVLTLKKMSETSETSPNGADKE